jgi:flagellar hook assembly protein FlgD
VLRIHDARGRLVRTLVDEVLPAATHLRTWDGTDAAGRRVASGVYYCRLSGPGGAATRKLLLLK